ncbi:MAG: quinolinate synthase NadA [Firmicutes bacterium]|nr:quinolinate synthase NadA [Bacillota bacterium]
MNSSWEQQQLELKEKILRLKAERNAVILAHSYQRREVQEAADLVGDSFQLARAAQDTDADIIVLAGVSFMAETAKLLNPDKVVLHPEPGATCPMAEMAEAKAVREYREKNPETLVVSYVNTLAEVKAESDICCTSANAQQVVESLEPGRPVIFLPDRNLGDYLNKKIGIDMRLWDGYCPIHQRLTAGEIEEARRLHPGAEVLVHPECEPEVIGLADRALGTTGMVKHVASSPGREFIIGTEEGLLHKLRREFPDRVFHLAAEHLVCPNMKSINLKKILDCLQDLEPRVEVPEEVFEKARRSLTRMMEIV